MQKQLPLTLAAAGLPQIPGLAGEARSYAERLFRFPYIGALDEQAARAALVIPAEREGATFDAEALERTLELTQAYPFYLQEFGKHIWNLAPASPITRADVEGAAPRAEEALDRGLYEVRIQRATLKERRYLRAMAELGAGPYKVGSVARAMGSTTTTLSTIRQKLLDRGLIYATEDYGYWILPFLASTSSCAGTCRTERLLRDRDRPARKAHDRQGSVIQECLPCYTFKPLRRGRAVRAPLTPPAAAPPRPPRPRQPSEIAAASRAHA